MEKKSIGQFISILRKASGMTQKELAEKLNVSDKAVSRWERDECAPDISAIPVIAEIFGVTCDEILRGERISSDIPYTKTSEEKTQKQFKRLLNLNTVKYHKRSIISVSLIFAGLICAMIGNYAFLKAYLGFFLGAIFFLFAAVSHSIFTIDAFSSVKDSDFASGELEAQKRHYFNLAYIIYGTIIIAIAVCLPLVYMSPGAEWGLRADTWFEGAAVFCGVAIIALIPVYSLSLKWAKKKKICLPSDKEKENEEAISQLKKKYTKKFIALAVVTAILFVAFNTVNLNYEYFFGEKFDTIEEFIAFMETPMADSSYVEVTQMFATTQVFEDDDSDTTYYDDEGNVISEEEALTEYIYSKDGKTVIGKYVQRNEDVFSIDYRWKDDKPIFYVMTKSKGMNRYEFEQTGFMIFALLCFSEIVGLSVSYYKKKKELI